MITRAIDENKLKAERPDMVAFDPAVRDLEPLAVGARTMCSLLSISENTLKRLVADGFPVVKLDGKNIFPIDLARQWLADRAVKATERN